MKKKKKNSVMEQVKASRKQSREEEIQKHGKSINYRKVMASKKQYNRKKNKADDEVLPYFFLRLTAIVRLTHLNYLTNGLKPLYGIYQILTLFSTGTNIRSPALIPNASYQVAI
jgi:hypothetical protein